MKSILGIGNAITDIPVFIPSNSLLEEFKFLPGSMNHIDAQVMAQLWKRVQGMDLNYVAGGSAANTVAALSHLGLECRFIGKTGADAVGESFDRGHRGDGVDMLLLKGEQESGRALAFISGENGERTFTTYLGAALEFSPEELGEEMFQGYELLHIEGYLMQAPGVVERAMAIAKGMGMKISIDLGSAGIVKRYREALHRLVADYADIVFANEQEAQAFSGLEGKEGLEYIHSVMKQPGSIAVVKLGGDGSMIKKGDEVLSIGAVPAEVVDTTGAGDAYAAGFLYALSCGASMEKCGETGSFVASEVVSVVGPKLTEDSWKAILVWIKSKLD